MRETNFIKRFQSASYQKKKDVLGWIHEVYSPFQGTHFISVANVVLGGTITSVSRSEFSVEYRFMLVFPDCNFFAASLWIWEIGSSHKHDTSYV
jgi:hypothetical protein